MSAVPSRRGRARRLPGPVGLAAYAAQVGGKEVFMEIARLSGDTLMRNVVALWDDLPESQRRGIRIEGLIKQVGLAPEDFLAELVRAGHRSGVSMAGIVLGLANPLVAEATVQAALKPDGYRDRRLIFQSSGLLPQAKGSFTAIHARNVQVNQGQPVQDPGLRSLEEENIIDVPVKGG